MYKRRVVIGAKSAASNSGVLCTHTHSAHTPKFQAADVTEFPFTVKKLQRIVPSQRDRLGHAP